MSLPFEKETQHITVIIIIIIIAGLAACVFINVNKMSELLNNVAV